MTNDEIRTIHQETENVFQGIRALLDENATKSYAEYLSVGEPGLVVHGLLYDIEMEGLAIPQNQKERLYALARRMKFDIEKLRAKWQKG